MIDAIKQMVEALEWCRGGEPIGTAEAIKAGKQAIKELESQKPVARLVYKSEGSAGPPARFEAQPEQDATMQSLKDLKHSVCDEVGKAAFAQPEQEPVACDCNQGQVCHICDPITHLSQRTWVGLTVKEVNDLYDSDYSAFHQRIEAKLKQKNG